jgi:hypothetical protein
VTKEESVGNRIRLRLVRQGYAGHGEFTSGRFELKMNGIGFRPNTRMVVSSEDPRSN